MAALNELASAYHVSWLGLMVIQTSHPQATEMHTFLTGISRTLIFGIRSLHSAYSL